MRFANYFQNRIEQLFELHIRVEEREQLLNAVLEVVRGQELVRERAETAQEHKAGARRIDDGFEQRVILGALQQVRPRADERMARAVESIGVAEVEDDRVGEVAVRAEGQVEIPRQDAPLAPDRK